MCDLKPQEDEGPEEGEIQDDDDEEESSVYLSSSSSSYDRDIRNHERQRAARKYLPHDPAGSLSMSIVNDTMLSRTNHDRKEKSRVRSKHSESTHHKTSAHPRSGLTHGKENRHVHQSRDKRSPPVPHSGRPKSRTPNRSPYSRDHSKNTSKCHRGVPENVSSRSSEVAERDCAAHHTRKRQRHRGSTHKREASAELKRTQAKKVKVSHCLENGEEIDGSSSTVLNVDASEENCLKRKLLTMGALPNQPQSANTPLGVLPNEGVTEVPDNSTETEVHSPAIELAPKESNEAVSIIGKDSEDVDNSVIFVAAVPKPMPELVTLSDSDAEQDTNVEEENIDNTKGATDMEMSCSSASSAADLDLETALDILPNNPPVSTIGQSDQDEDDIISLRRAALLSKNKPSKDPATNAEQDDDDLLLRVEALRSAVMRKAEVRKKRRLQTVGGQVLGDETTPVDMDLADTDDEEDSVVSQPQPSPEPPPLPLPPLPSDSLLKTVSATTPSGNYFPEPVRPSLPPPCHYMQTGFLELALQDNLCANNVRFPMDAPPPTPFPVLPPPRETVPDMDARQHSGFLGHPSEFPAQAQPVEFPPHPSPMDFPVVHPVPPPLEYPTLPLEYPPPAIPPVALDYPVPNPSIDYDPAVPTPYQDSFPDTNEPLPEVWNQDEAPASQEPLSSILTKAMKKKIQNSRPNLREIQVSHTPPQKDKHECEIAHLELSSMVVLDEVADSPVPSPANVLTDCDKTEPPSEIPQRQSSFDEDELFLREKLLKAISSKRETSKPQDSIVKTSDQPSNKPQDSITKTSDQPSSRSQDSNTKTSDQPASRPQDSITKTSEQSLSKPDSFVGKSPSKPQSSKSPDKTRKPQIKNGTSKAHVVSKGRLVYSKADTLKVQVPVQPRNTYPVRKADGAKQQGKTAQAPFQFIIQLGEDSDSSDGLEDMEVAEDANALRREPSMYHMKDYYPRTGAGETEKACEEVGSTQSGAAPCRSELDLSKEVDKFLKDVRSSHEASANAPPPESPTISQVAILKPVDVTPLAIRHLPASTQEEYRKLKQIIAEKELQKKALKKLSTKPTVQTQSKVADNKKATSKQAAQPIATSAQPIAKVAEPIVKAAEPIVKAAEPIATAVRSITSAQPIATSAQPMVESAQPIATSAQPMVEAAQSIATSVQPMANAPQPIAKETEPIATDAQPIAAAAQPPKQPTKVRTVSPPTTSPKPSIPRPAQSDIPLKSSVTPPILCTPPKATAPHLTSPILPAPVLSVPPRGFEATVMPSTSNRPRFATKKTLFPGPYSVPHPVSKTNTDFFCGAPIIYGQCVPESVLSSCAPKVPTPGAGLPIVINHTIPVPQPKATASPISPAPATPVPVLSAPVPSTTAPVTQLVGEKELGEAEINLLKERSAVVGQIMGLTRLQNETENSMTALDVCESNLLRVIEEFDAACKEWQERSNVVKRMMMSVKEKREQLRGSYVRTDALARSCLHLGAQIKGSSYTLPAGGIMQSKQKIANQQYGRMIKWRKVEQRRMRGAIAKTDTISAFLKSRCQESLSTSFDRSTISGNPSTVFVNPRVVSFNPSSVSVNSSIASINPPAISISPSAISVGSSVMPVIPSTISVSALAVSRSAISVSSAVMSVSPSARSGSSSTTSVSLPAISISTARDHPLPIPVGEHPTPPEVENSLPVRPEVAAPQEEDISENKSTPSLFCARRIVRVAKKRLREGGKPREMVNEPRKKVLGADDNLTSERKKQQILTSYQSPLDHLRNCGSHDVGFDPDAILCPYELNGKCEDNECAFQHQVKSANRES